MLWIILRTVVIIEHLTGGGTQGLHVFPYPPRAIRHHTEPDCVFWHHPRFLDLLERLSELLLCLYLMPAQEMHDPVVSKEVEAQREHSVILTAHR